MTRLRKRILPWAIAVGIPAFSYLVLVLVNVVFAMAWVLRARRHKANARPSAADVLIGVGTNFLDTLGIGNYAPTMAVLYLLGMSPLMVFPIMATCAALILPTAALRFHRSGRYSRPVARALALGGLPGVLVAFYLVRSLEVGLLRWLVVGVLCYTSIQMYRSSLQGTPP